MAPSTHLHIDPFAGIAGDMFLGACIDLGVKLDDLRQAFVPAKLDLPCELSAEPTTRCGISGIDFRVSVETPADYHKHTHLSDMAAIIEAIDAPPRARQRATRIVTVLAEAEAAVHDIAVEKVHFHEVGAVDSIIDLIGAAVAAELLGIESVSCAPLPMGYGTVECAHGTMPLPAPATARILQGKPTYGVDRRCETVTPSGAAIVVGLADRFGPQPAMRVDRVGYGAGDRDEAGIANMVRLHLGELTAG